MQYPIPQPRPMMPQTGQGLLGSMMPQAQGGNRLMNFARNNSDALLAMSAGLLGGQTGSQQAMLGMQGFADARKGAREKQQAMEQQNMTLAWLDKNRPDLSEMVKAGMPIEQAWQQAVKTPQAQMSEYAEREAAARKFGVDINTPEGKAFVLGGKFEPGGGAKQTDDIAEYQFARQNGFQGSFMDFQQQVKGASAPRSVGTIPPGMQLVSGPDGAMRMEPIPGGPAEQEAMAAQSANQSKMEGETQKAQIASTAVDRILQKIDKPKGMFDLPEVGIIGGRLADANINQEAIDVKNDLATLQSIVSFDRLQAMRDASPTGGALGAVSERELALLQSSLGALNQYSSPEQLRETLTFIKSVMDKFAAYPQQAQAAGGMPSAGSSDVDALVDQYAD